MNQMTDPKYVAALKSNIHATFETPQGKEVMRFLEQTCCWYKSVFDPSSPDLTLINDGKRQVIATIKTVMELSADQLVSLAKRAEGES